MKLRGVHEAKREPLPGVVGWFAKIMKLREFWAKIMKLRKILGKIHEIKGKTIENPLNLTEYIEELPAENKQKQKHFSVVSKNFRLRR